MKIKDSLLMASPQQCNAVVKHYVEIKCSKCVPLAIIRGLSLNRY